MFRAGLNKIWQRLGLGTTAAFGLFLLALLAYAGYFTYYALSALDLTALLRDVNVDDSFYYFQIARNMAEGRFSTFDGGITRTNGYHPVWMLLITPFYWALDRETALLGIKVFELCLIGGSAALLTVAARLCRLPWLALVAVLPLLYQQNALWLGLEASAGLFALSLLFLSLSLTARRPERWWPLLAAVAFLLPWVRLEYLAISLAATAGAAIVGGRRAEPSARVGAHPAGLRNRIRRPLSAPPDQYAPLLSAGLGGLIYFAYNRLVFGGYVPVSGAHKAVWSQQWFERAGGFDLVANALAHWQHSAFSYELLIAAEVCAYALIVWWVGRRASNPPHQLLPFFLVGAAALAIGHAAKFVQHALTMHPYYNDDWYFVPAYLMLALIIPLRCFTAVYLIKLLVSPRWPQTGRLLTAGSVAAAVIALAVTVDFTKPFRFIDDIQPVNYRDWEITSYLGTQVTNHLLPDDAVVGSWDAGVVGYFADFPVVNLDGLANSYGHYNRYAGHWAPTIQYVHEYGITHYANVRKIGIQPINTIFEGVRFEAPTGFEEDSEVASLEFNLWLAAPDATVADRTTAADRRAVQKLRTMLQERADYYSGNVAALVSSNLVHTFYFDCAPQRTNALALTVSGDFPANAENKYGDSLVYFWNDLHRNNLGYCAEAFELPAGAALPVSVAVKPFAAAANDLLRKNTPIVQSDWDVYRIGRQLLYHRAPCAPDDTTGLFYRYLIPADTNHLSGWERELGFDKLDFDFVSEGGVRYDGKCLLRMPLPDYEIHGIRTGQFAPETGRLWSGEFYAETYLPDQPSMWAARASGTPAAADFFSIYYDDDQLTYSRKECVNEDTQAPFYLHPVPVAVDDLPAAQREHGFDNLDFYFDLAGGVIYEGRCLVSVPLPDYQIRGIRTGQFVPGAGRLWSSEFYTEAGIADRSSRLSAQTVGAPAATSFFSVYHGAGALTYIREDCAPADTAAAFYLHIIPSDADDLPAGRREHGFDNRNFDFGSAGGVQHGGRCRVSVPLPDYPIDRIRTGQFLQGAGQLWTAEFAVAE